MKEIFGCDENDLPSFKGDKIIAVDIETCDPDLKTLGAGVRTNGYIVGVAIAGYPSMRSCYVPFAHELGFNFDKALAIRWLKSILETDVPKLGANLIYDLDYLYQYGISVRGKFRDVQIAEPLINENRKQYGLDSLSYEYLGVGKYEDEMETWVVENLGKRAKTKENIWRIPSELVSKYARMDVELPLKVYMAQRKKLFSENLWDLFELETDLIPMLLAMKRRGVSISVDQAESMQQTLEHRIEKEYHSLRDISAAEVNIHAADSISKACDRILIDYPETKTGRPSFTRKWMETRASLGSFQEKQFFSSILSLRKLEKFKGTFIEGAILKHNVKGRIHCQFNQLKSDEYGTVSGRFSSSSPNLQQVPSRDGDLAKEIRGLFVPEPGHFWLKLDFKAIEPRVAIHYAYELGLDGAEYAVEFLRNNPNADVYQPMMDKLPQLSRSVIKMVYLGISYSMGAGKLAKAIEVSEEEAKDIIREFNNGVPYIRQLADMYRDKASSQGWIETLMGRRRHFDKYLPKNMKYRKDFGSDAAYEQYKSEIKPLDYEEAQKQWHKVGCERAFTYKAFNSLIQGSSADIMKKAMLDVWNSGICGEIGVPLLTVHDELDFSVPDTKRGHEIVQQLKHLMENAVKLHVPLTVDAEKGSNWGNVK